MLLKIQFFESNAKKVSSLVGIICALFSFRFPGQLNSSFRKIMMNTVPFPLLHFLVPTHVPLNSIKWKPDYALLYLTRQMFDHKNMFFNCDVRLGQYLTVAVIFRDSVTSQVFISCISEKSLKYLSRLLSYLESVLELLSHFRINL